ncbi:hypothetical protein K8I61_06020 [bacterium]|nr:hypothetical protein [bacterium]
MKKIRRIICLVVVAAVPVLFGASCGGCGSREAAAPTGADSPEELAQKYLDAVSAKDYELFETLLLDRNDLKPFAKQMNKQGVTVYHQFVLRDFQTRNRDYLGKELKYVAFRLGREVWSQGPFALHRGSTVIAELPDGSKVNLDINFVSKVQNKWKIFSLRYIKDIRGANPGAAGPPPIPGSLPGAKFGPEKGNVQLKVRKVEPDGEGAQEAPTAEGEAAGSEAAPAADAPAESDAPTAE